MKTVSENERNELIKEYRKLIMWGELDFESDQDLKRTQPPLVKKQMTDKSIALPTDFSDLPLEKDFVKIINMRRSNRVFTEKGILLLTLSFLLWSMQGVKDIRGKNYATLRTVPSGGARHPFETYFFVKNVEGLTEGLYHYLPLKHEIELLKDCKDTVTETASLVSDALCEQTWAKKADVTFFFSIVPYRSEWRYAFDAHRVMMIDAGHVTENLYLSCAALNLGTCAIAAADTTLSNQLFGIKDEDDEYIFYASPVGTIDQKNEDEEQSFYAFLKEE